MRRNIIQEKSFDFAVQIVRFSRYLQTAKREFVLSKQLGGQSEKDFVGKISIAAKEARETHYWLRLLRESGVITEPRIGELLKESQEISKVLNSIILTTRQKLEARTSKSIISTFNSEPHTLNSQRSLPNSELSTQHSALPSGDWRRS